MNSELQKKKGLRVLSSSRISESQSTIDTNSQLGDNTRVTWGK